MELIDLSTISYCNRPHHQILIDTILIMSSYLPNCCSFSYPQSDGIHNRISIAGDDLGDACDGGCLYRVS